MPMVTSIVSNAKQAGLNLMEPTSNLLLPVHIITHRQEGLDMVERITEARSIILPCTLLIRKRCIWYLLITWERRVGSCGYSRRRTIRRKMCVGQRIINCSDRGGNRTHGPALKR